MDTQSPWPEHPPDQSEHFGETRGVLERIGAKDTVYAPLRRGQVVAVVFENGEAPRLRGACPVRKVNRKHLAAGLGQEAGLVPASSSDLQDTLPGLQPPTRHVEFYLSHSFQSAACFRQSSTSDSAAAGCSAHSHLPMPYTFYAYPTSKLEAPVAHADA